MKRKLQVFLIPLLISIFFGYFTGKIVYHIYDTKIDNILSSSVIYLLETGSYVDYDTMRTNNLNNSYVYYKDNDNYKTIIGITKNKDNITKIASIYDNDIIIDQYYLNDKNMDSKIMIFDEKLSSEDNVDNIKSLTAELMGYYKEKNITLTKID